MVIDILKAILSVMFGRAVVATILLVGTVGLLWAGMDVPSFLIGFDGLVVGFFFGTTIANNGK
jgi:hypothetical protein